MVDETIREEIEEKLKRHLDSSYVIIRIGDLRELIPELHNLIQQEHSEPKLIPQPKPIVSKDEIITLEELERRLIHASLEKAGGCVEEAANLIGISERNFYRKIQGYKIDHTKFIKK